MCCCVLRACRSHPGGEVICADDAWLPYIVSYNHPCACVRAHAHRLDPSTPNYGSCMSDAPGAAEHQAASRLQQQLQANTANR